MSASHSKHNHNQEMLMRIHFTRLQSSTYIHWMVYCGSLALVYVHACIILPLFMETVCVYTFVLLQTITNTETGTDQAGVSNCL